MARVRSTVEVQCTDCGVRYNKRADGMVGCHYVVTFGREMPEGTVWGHNLSRRAAS
jgi:hypothetical protein